MNTGWRTLPFDDAVKDASAGNAKLQTGEYLPLGRYPIVDQGKDLIAGYSDNASLLANASGPVIIFGDHTRIFKYVDFPFCVGADGVKVLKPVSDLDPKYAFHFLSKIELPSDGYSRHFKYLRRTEISFPSLDEQRRIAAILDQADDLRRKRREVLSRISVLLQTIFVDMFGDPATNPKGWPTPALGAVSIRFSDGPFGSNLKSEHYAERGIRVVRLQNIGVGEFLETDKVFISEAHFRSLQKHSCLPGDVLIGTLGDPNLRAVIQPNYIPLALNKADCVQMRVDPRICTPEYIAALLNYPSTEAMAHDKIMGQTRLRISMGRLRELSMPMPSLDLQRAFAGRVAEIDKLKAHHRIHLAKLDTLFASLQHRAFRGEL